MGKVKDFPYIKASSWVKLMSEQGFLHKLFGLGSECNTLELAEPHLSDFWKKYELTHSDHQVFGLARAGLIRLSHCVPIYIHGDEGTTYKRDGALVLSFFNPIGNGVAGARTGENRQELQMNFLGHAFSTRMVMGTLMKATCL